MTLKLTLVTAPSPILCQSSRFGAQAMAAATIHVVPDDNFDDWVVRADVGRNSATTPLEKPPNGLRRRSRKSARPNSSSTSRTEEPAERILQKSWAAGLFRR
jgi:hypothetical protein